MELAEYLNYLHVIDDDKKLSAVSYRDLPRPTGTAHRRNYENTIVTVDALMDQEEAARIIQLGRSRNDSSR